MGNQLKVSRVTAQAIVTLVVHLLLTGYVPVEMSEYNKVNSYGLIAQGHSTVATTTPST
jgi:hypothetical protein